MGYFPNGTSQELYEIEYCYRCVHYRDDSAMCPAMWLHFLWNYDAVGKNFNVDKRQALDEFIPRSSVVNERCTMFYRVQEAV